MQRKNVDELRPMSNITIVRYWIKLVSCCSHNKSWIHSHTCQESTKGFFFVPRKARKSDDSRGCKEGKKREGGEKGRKCSTYHCGSPSWPLPESLGRDPPGSASLDRTNRTGRDTRDRSDSRGQRHHRRDDGIRRTFCGWSAHAGRTTKTGTVLSSPVTVRCLQQRREKLK